MDTFRKVDTIGRMGLRMGSGKGGRRPRRQFSDEFMAGAVRLVLDEGKTIGAVARELDLTPSSLANWVRHAQADRTKGRTGLTTEERVELAALRKENRQLRMERDILKKPRPFSPRTPGNVRLDRRGEGRVPDHDPLSGPAGLDQWVLCVARPPRVGTRPHGPALGGTGARVVRRAQAAVRQSWGP